jgi:hypothetical protein
MITEQGNEVASITPISAAKAIIHKHSGWSADKSRFYIWTKQGYQLSQAKEGFDPSSTSWFGDIVDYVKTEKEAVKWVKGVVDGDS